ncbi:histidine kinase [Streptomyces sp. NBC_01142]|uniref:histidine kinase n=1 Tax=Streptomyces sp. NBC_01142 TaxID=2975865 RepID=UPI00224DE99F|nr:histidine kinase [Streptomyces sp. NBC_01142]MCX4826149.1 histidine kinase [Streptomyces sp. NBC_01142]
MLDPFVTATALLSGGFAATSMGLIVQARSKRALTARIKPLEEQRDTALEYARAVEAESKHFAEVRMPALVDALARGHRGVPVPGLSQDRLSGSPIDYGHQVVMGLLQEALTIAREQIGLAARSSVRDIIDEAQTHLHRCQLNVVQEMDRYPEGTAYHQSLMGFDHLVTQALHMLQRTRILTGSWPGLQRADCTFGEVVESARGRINAYLRVNYTYEPGSGESWLEGRVVEPVTVTLTELLSNATSYSDGKVFVEVQAFQTGYCIVVDDGGLNMNAYQREEAARQLSQRTVLDVTALQDTRQLGFAVIGRLAGEYGFAADVTSTSPYGGVRAVLRIPRDLFGHGPTEEETEAERRAAASRAAGHATAAEPPTGSDHADSPGERPGGTVLPQRRRRSPRPAAPIDTSTPAPADDPEAFSQGFAHLAETIRDSETNRTEGEQYRA